MKHNTELIVGESDIEILVGYDFSISESEIIEFHGLHEVGKRIHTELTSVEVFFGEHKTDILQLLTGLQIEFIISKLKYIEQ